MKLPRWIVVSLLTVSALSLPGAAGWWWVTWPEKTIRAYVHAMGNDEDVFPFLGSDLADAFQFGKEPLVSQFSARANLEIEFESRSVSDFCRGRLIGKQTDEHRTVYFTAVRGVIVDTG